jgi:hypothetical protein
MRKPRGSTLSSVGYHGECACDAEHAICGTIDFDQFFKFCSVFKLSNFHRRTAAKRTRSSQLA